MTPQEALIHIYDQADWKNLVYTVEKASLNVDLTSMQSQECKTINDIPTQFFYNRYVYSLG